MVAKLFESLGAAVIDADRMVHEQLEDPGVVGVLRGWWGDRINRQDGGIDRTVVASIVFDDPAERRRLEGLLYPRLAAERRRLMAALDEDDSVRAIVLDAPKLYEAGVDRECDVVVFVDADADVRARRVEASKGWTRTELSRREKAMEALDKKRAKAEYVVTNQTSTEDLRVQVERVFAAVMKTFGE
jgi:dephospho-CoA kinase